MSNFFQWLFKSGASNSDVTLLNAVPVSSTAIPDNRGSSSSGGAQVSTTTAASGSAAAAVNESLFPSAGQTNAYYSSSPSSTSPLASAAAASSSSDVVPLHHAASAVSPSTQKRISQGDAMPPRRSLDIFSKKNSFGSKPSLGRNSLSIETGSRLEDVESSPLPDVPAPWLFDVPEHWKGHEDLLKDQILKISFNVRSFLIDAPTSMVYTRDFAAAAAGAARADEHLIAQRANLVPSVIENEPDFWRAYFYNIKIIKDSKPEEVSSGELFKRLTALQETSHFAKKSVALRQQVLKSTKFMESTCSLCLQEIQEEMGRLIGNMIQKKSTADEADGSGASQRRARHAAIDALLDECIDCKKKISLLMTPEIMSDEICIAAMRDSNQSLQKVQQEHEKYAKLSKMKKDIDTTAYNPQLLCTTRDPPSITTATQRQALCRVLPPQARRWDWKLVYSTLEHGISIKTMFRRAMELPSHAQTILFVQTRKGCVFGAFMGAEWRMSVKYYGTGDTFLFTFRDDMGSIFEHFSWSQENEYFIRSSESVGVVFGGGASGKAGLYIDNEFMFGSTHRCETYNNKCLNAHDEEDFEILAAELWTFETISEKETRLSGGAEDTLLRHARPRNHVK